MSFKSFLALEASAGSGKTFALSVRFVALILKGAKISEIMALTFSKKAMKEMKERIIDTFLNLEKESKKNELSTLITLLQKDKNEILRLRDIKKEEFLRANLKIFTFDSFFAQILRAFSLNLGLMSDFELREKSLDVRFEFIKSLQDHELEILANYLLNLDKKFFNDLELLYKNGYQKDFKNAHNPSKDAILQAFYDLKNYALTLSENANFKKNFALDEKDFDIEELCKKPIICDLNKIYFKDLLQNELFMQKRNKLIEAINTYANELEDFKLFQIQSLLNAFKKAKLKQEKALNTLSFDDVSLNVFELSKDHFNEFNELIYFYLDAKISHLLIDEFQDTNYIQYEILKPIISEIVAGEGVKKDKSFFYVGDKKQSIYGFRGSKKELFDQLRQDFKQIELEKLSTNYRSHKILVQFVNEIFSQKYENYEPQKALEEKDQGFIKIIQSKDDEDIKNSAFQAVLEELEFLKSKNANLNDTCILCWKNDEANSLVEFLQEKGFQAFTQSNIELENKASVRVLLEYAKYCIFGDALYLETCKALLNPASLIEEEQLNKALSIKSKPELFVPKKLELRLNENPVQICLYLAKKLGLNLADSALIQYLEYARSKESFLELLFEKCEKKIANDENLGINVMTVHKSKGLEFDNVILLDSLSKPRNDEDNLMFDFDIQKGIKLKIKDKIRGLTKEKAYEEFMQKRKEEERQNTINALYVAFTRAKKALFIIKKNEAHNKSDIKNYFDDDNFLKLQAQERGVLQTQISKPFLNTPQKSLSLEKFAKISLQEKDKTIIKNSPEIIFGEAFHFILQMLDLKDFSNLNTAHEKMYKKYHHFLDEELLGEVLKRVQSLLNEPRFKALIAKKQLFKEQALSFEGQIKQLDLLCVADDEAFIIDYKTGQSDRKEHEKQVLFYKKAIENILKKPITRAFLIYCLKSGVEILEL